MFSADFDYFRATSVAEAGELLAKYPNEKLLADKPLVSPPNSNSSCVRTNYSNIRNTLSF